jgi:hypothetical protein
MARKGAVKDGNFQVGREQKALTEVRVCKCIRIYIRIIHIYIHVCTQCSAKGSLLSSLTLSHSLALSLYIHSARERVAWIKCSGSA